MFVHLFLIGLIKCGVFILANQQAELMGLTVVARVKCVHLQSMSKLYKNEGSQQFCYVCIELKTLSATRGQDRSLHISSTVTKCVPFMRAAIPLVNFTVVSFIEPIGGGVKYGSF